MRVLFLEVWSAWSASGLEFIKWQSDKRTEQRGTHYGCMNLFWDPWNGASRKRGWGLGIGTGMRLGTVGVVTRNPRQVSTKVFFFGILRRGIYGRAGGGATIRGCGGWGDFLSLLDCDCSGTHLAIIEKVTGPVPDKSCQAIFLTLSPVI